MQNQKSEHLNPELIPLLLTTKERCISLEDTEVLDIPDAHSMICTFWMSKVLTGKNYSPKETLQSLEVDILHPFLDNRIN